MNVSWYMKWILISLVILVALFLRFPDKSLLMSLILHTIQVAGPLIAAVRLFMLRQEDLKIDKVSKNLFAFAFLVLAFTDFFYFLLLFFLKESTNNLFVRLITTLPYYLSYLFVGIGMIRVAKVPAKQVTTKAFWIFPILTSGLSFPFIILPSIRALHFGDVMGFVQAVAIPGALFMMNVAFLIMISTRDLNWSIFSMGWFAFGVTDWAIQAETLNRSSPVPSFNAYLWTFSGILACLPFFRRVPRFGEFERYDDTSLTSSIRLRSLCALSIPLFFLGYTLNTSWYGVVLLSFGFVFGALAVVLVTQYLLERLQSLREVLEKLSGEDLENDFHQKSVSQIPVELREQVIRVIRHRVADEAKKTQDFMQSAKEIAGVCAQVSHDIQSPLAALEMIARQSSSLPEDERFLLRTIVDRLKGISSNLLEHYFARPTWMREKFFAITKGTEPYSVELLPLLIASIVNEKRVQIGEGTKIHIDYDLSAQSLNAYAEVQPIEFKRAVSNILNNSFDAMKGEGTINIRTVINDPEINVIIEDTGFGMSADILYKVKSQGGTFGKARGMGLGLAHSKATMASIGGRFEIESWEGKGTKVTFFIPCASPPSWALSELILTPTSTVYVVDDDPTIHHVWQQRLKEISIKYGVKIKVHNCWTPGELLNEVRNFSGSFEDRFLVDYEFPNTDMNGLDLILKLGIPNQSILVTNRAEDTDLRKKCENMGSRLLSKQLAALVPLRIVKDDMRT